MREGKLKFQFRSEHDVVIVTVDWHLETEDDLDPWYEAYARYFRTNFKRKVDVIFDLTKFHLSPKVAQRFGEVRAKLLREYTARTYRVRLDPFVKTAMYTSRVLHGAPANDFPTIEAALEQLLKDRAEARSTSSS